MAVHVKAVWLRSAPAVEDVAVTTHDLEGADVDAVSAVTIRNRFTTWMTAIAGRIATQCQLQELRFYNGYNGDGSPGQFDFVLPVGVAGTDSSGMLPPQCSCSVTEELYESHLRRNWGRFYIPGPGKLSTGVDGRFTPFFVDLIADATQVLYNGLNTDGWVPIVWITSPTLGQAIVDGIRVDDIVDIQRRRRFETFITRELRDLVAGGP